MYVQQRQQQQRQLIICYEILKVSHFSLSFDDLLRNIYTFVLVETLKLSLNKLNFRRFVT